MKGLFLHAKWDPKPEYKLNDYEIKTGKALASNNVWRYPRLEMKDGIPEPEIGPRDVLLKVMACGICGSDLHFAEPDSDGYMVYPGHTRMNIVLGHEVSGVIEKMGNEVEGFEIGDTVAVEEMIWCGECTPCRNGFPNQCARLEEIGVTKNGGMEPYVAVPAKLCWKLNEMKKLYGDGQELFERGALVEPTSVAYNAIFERGQGFRPGAYAAVFGGGPIGLLGAGLMKAGGASRVIVFEPQVKRRELAKKMGADFVIDTGEIAKQGVKPHEVIMELTHGDGADILMEAAGVPDITMPEIMKSLAVNAHIIQTAMSGVTVPVVFVPLQARAGQIFGSVGHSGNGTFENVIRLMASGLIDVKPVISAKFKLDDAIEAFKVANERDGAKVILIP
ncbi:MAG: scyllo-inosose 3-dehydrogenase [Clostridiales bacterium]|nr:scyllo-inosose 3-dehydrogenase [Clostridiales bacterium]